MMIFKKAIPRRTFLRGAGAALALPLLDAMVPAMAAPTDTASKSPLRMGFVYVPNGIVMRKWTPIIEGVNWETTPILEPLTPFRDRMLVLSGLDNLTSMAQPGEGGAHHTRASATFLTGVHPKATDGIDIRAGVSVDQIAAREMGKQTQMASLELALDPVFGAGVCEPSFTCAYLNTISWRTPTTPMPMEDKPRVLFERLFGDSDSTDRAARLTRIQEKRSILDDLNQTVAGMTASLAPADRAKVSEYLDAVRDVERRIQLAEEQSSRELPTIDRPAGGYPASYEQYAKLMIDLQVLAYQTDLTRVITFMLAHEKSDRSYREIGIPDAHHPLSHHRGDPASIEKLIRLNTYHVKMFAYYMEKLRSTRDGNGSLLDNIMMVYGCGIADGNLHTNEDLGILLMGGGGGKIKTGRHVRYPKGTPLTNLYLRMLEITGTPMDKLGDSTGKLNMLSV
jgi:hypothetical protein